MKRRAQKARETVSGRIREFIKQTPNSSVEDISKQLGVTKQQVYGVRHSLSQTKNKVVPPSTRPLIEITCTSAEVRTDEVVRFELSHATVVIRFSPRG